MQLIWHWFGRVWFHSEWITVSICWFMLSVWVCLCVCIYRTYNSFVAADTLQFLWTAGIEKVKGVHFPSRDQSRKIDNLSARLPPGWNTHLNIFPRVASPLSVCFTLSTPIAVSRRCSERWNQNVLMLEALIVPVLLGFLISEALNQVLRNFWEEGWS